MIIRATSGASVAQALRDELDALKNAFARRRMEQHELDRMLALQKALGESAAIGYAPFIYR